MKYLTLRQLMPRPGQDVPPGGRQMPPPTIKDDEPLPGEDGGKNKRTPIKPPFDPNQKNIIFPTPTSVN